MIKRQLLPSRCLQPGEEDRLISCPHAVIAHRHRSPHREGVFVLDLEG